MPITQNIQDINEHIEAFLEYLQIEKGRSSHTIKNYYFYLKRFAEFIEDLPLENITIQTIQRFSRFLKNELNEKELKNSTLNYHLIALRSFFTYLKKQGIAPLPPGQIHLVKMPERKINILTRRNLTNLLQAPLQSDEEEIIRIRDKAVLEMLIATGMRVSELSSLQKHHLHLSTQSCTIRRTRTGYQQVVFTERAAFWLNRYLSKRTDNAPAVFIRHDKAQRSGDPKPLTPRSIQRIVKKYSTLLGLSQNITPHTLRHTFAVHLIAQGENAETLKDILGHITDSAFRSYTKIVQSNFSSRSETL